jgi:hypothetical protein
MPKVGVHNSNNGLISVSASSLRTRDGEEPLEDNQEHTKVRKPVVFGLLLNSSYLECSDLCINCSGYYSCRGCFVEEVRQLTNASQNIEQILTCINFQVYCVSRSGTSPPRDETDAQTLFTSVARYAKFK